jgi:hypothetical protein
MNNEKIYVYNHNINTAGFLKKTLEVCDFAEWIEKIIFSDLA